MRVYLAAPFFNVAQLDIVNRIEQMLKRNHHSYYSPRLHSGSADIRPEDRKDPKVWEPVLKSNIDELDRCDIVLAVFEYAMPHDYKLGIVRTIENYGDGGRCDYIKLETKLELPDNGVVWECGNAYRAGKPTFGFHSKKQLSEMNLMLSHTVQGMITGFDNLEKFLRGQGSQPTDLSIQSVHAKLEYFGVETHTGEII